MVFPRTVREVLLAKRPKAYRSEKRGKEIARQKKQEEKRQRRQGKLPADQTDPEKVESQDRTE
jgi:hypothetical protein